MDNVSANIDEAVIIDLRQRKLLREQAEHVELDSVMPGENIVGYLTTEERLVYCEIVTLGAEFNDLNREIRARSYEMIAAAVRHSDKPDDLHKNLDEAIMFPNLEEAEEFFSMETKLSHLRAIFQSSIRERYGHSGIYGVRNSFSVVRTGYKHKLLDELKKA